MPAKWIWRRCLMNILRRKKHSLWQGLSTAGLLVRPLLLLTAGIRGPARPYSMAYAQRRVREARSAAKLGNHVTLDACRHGGMTELEEAELTDGQGRALSTHKTQQSYEGYAKRTAKRMLSATRKRHAHRLASQQNEQGDSVRNGAPESVRNDTPEQKEISKQN